MRLLDELRQLLTEPVTRQRRTACCSCGCSPSPIPTTSSGGRVSAADARRAGAVEAGGDRAASTRCWRPSSRVADDRTFDEEQLVAFMQSINAIRLVLGTMLGRQRRSRRRRGRRADRELARVPPLRVPELVARPLRASGSTSSGRARASGRQPDRRRAARVGGRLVLLFGDGIAVQQGHRDRRQRHQHGVHHGRDHRERPQRQARNQDQQQQPERRRP